ncbi:MAG: sulfatase-like hydrolase/transferase [Candidatus Schekmanbacteria bacterium]|nr:sulfatase-like hydrolase/transferase [Candidatus Schekmanbacteria bacterium]
MPVNLFSVSSDTALFFAEYFLNLRRVLLTGAVWIVLVVTSSRFPRLRRPQATGGWITAAVLALPLPVSLCQGPVNPVLFSLVDGVSQLASSAKGAHLGLVRLHAPVWDDSSTEKYPLLYKELKDDSQKPSRYDKIAVFVMESVSADDFYGERPGQGHTFYDSHKNNVERYTNYHTLNLDSYTSLISMTHSIFVPYQAYSSPERYDFINKRNNLVRHMKVSGYESVFATSYGEQQLNFVPAATEWDRIIVQEKIQDSGEFECINDSLIDKSCEDLSILSMVADALEQPGRVFLFQEMVYGHTAEWQQRMGMSAVEYYNVYFTRLYNEIERRHLADDTLFVVVSDHGPRLDATCPENYHIPLMLMAKDIIKKDNDTFLSHIDFAEIISSGNATNKQVSETKELFIIGNSGELVYGKLSSDGDHIFINNDSLSVDSNAYDPDARELNVAYQRYVNAFGKLR